MKRNNYEPRPSFYRKSMHRAGMFMALVIGWPVMFALYGRVAVYIAGFVIVVFVYWAIWTIIQRWK